MGIRIDEEGLYHEDEEVAIKILPYEEGNDEVNKKLSAEISVMKKCHGCDRIVQYFGNFIEQKKKHKHLWLVMEYCDNLSLRAYMTGTDQPFKEGAIASIMKQCLKGLDFMHKVGLIHRDIKSANLLWNSKGEVKLADLGEAISLADTNEWGEDMFAGTPYFMAPEVSNPVPYNEKVDIWSIGVMALELAEINPPFFSDPPFKVIFQIATQNLIPKLTHPEKFTSHFADFVDKCIQYDASKRASASELLRHPWFESADSAALLEVARTYSEILKKKEQEREAREEGSAKSKKRDTERTPSTKDQIPQIVYRERTTGETLEEFLRNLLLWKEDNTEMINTLIQHKPPSLQKSDSKMKSFFKGLFKDQDLKEKMNRLSVLVHLAWKASSTSFGVIVADRHFHGVSYDRCFVGKDGVDWVYQNLQMQSRSEAVNLIHQLIVSELIFGITNNTLTNVDSELSYFRFNIPKIKEWHEGYSKIYRYDSMDSATSADLRRSQSFEKGKPSEEEVQKRLGQPTELNERDWSLILAGANPEQFQKDALIVQEGTYNRCIYRIKKGTVRVERIENGRPVVLTTMNPGQMFGEMSVLTQSKTSATIRADSSPTEIYVTEVTFMNRLFQTEPGMQQRFYKKSAMVLAKKLRELGSAKDDKKDKQENKTEQSPAEIDTQERDKKYRALFSLPQSEILIQEYACYLNGIIKEHGKLYLSSNYVCFFAKVFGKQTKVVIDVEELVHAEVTEKRSLILRGGKKKLKLHGLTDPRSVMTLVLTLRDSHKKSRDPVKNSTQKPIAEEEILSPDDWQLLLQESKCKTFPKDAVIMKEGEWATRIHQIAKGTCRVEKYLDGEDVILAKMENGELFGEISFLEGVKATASVVADEEGTDVYIIEGAALTVLFARQPALAGRFYQYLAQLLSTRLREREKQMERSPATTKERRFTVSMIK